MSDIRLDQMIIKNNLGNKIFNALYTSFEEDWNRDKAKSRALKSRLG